MERIAPLAKILAEANGIEWENLTGTGAGGQIVEQDILDYLTRVMSGEAEPPSTPVDPTPPDWTGEDIPGGGMFDAAALSQAGVESDIADFVQQSRPATPSMPAPAAPSTLQSDDFELDDEPAPTMASQPAAASAPEEPAPAPAPVVETPPPAPASAGLGSLLSRLYHKEEPVTATPPVVETPAPKPVDDVVPAPMTAPVVETPAPSIAEPAPYTPPAPSNPFNVPPVASTPVEVEREPEPVPSAPVQLEPPHAEPVRPEPVAETPAVVVPEPSPAPAPAPMAEAPTPSQPAQPPVSMPTNAVWFGTYLRRDANVAGLMDLRSQLSEALERDVPLALLVARAAARHMDQLGLNNVAMQDLQAARARTVQSQGAGVRDALQAIDTDFDGTPELLVVDAGQLDLDDLHYPHTTTLSVGRVQDGRASLSLQGDVDQQSAARFLASVAQTLEKPVILLV